MIKKKKKAKPVPMPEIEPGFLVRIEGLDGEFPVSAVCEDGMPHLWMDGPNNRKIQTAPFNLDAITRIKCPFLDGVDWNRGDQND